jgi:steroid 5-alpha reductase family enzyme
MSLWILGGNAALVFALMTALWLVSVRLRDASIVDPWWSISFLIITVHTAVQTGLTPAKLLLLAAVSSWSLRLWLHLLLRSRGQPEDPRYANFRRQY